MRTFLPVGFLHRIPCLFHVLTIHGMCPTNRRQWADSLVSLMALLHRQYKTARTELAVICYWSQGRWRLKQRLRAVMFYSAVPQGTHGNPKIVCRLRTHPWSAQNLEKHGSSPIQNPAGLEMPHFLIRISRYIPSEIEEHELLAVLLIVSKGAVRFKRHPVAFGGFCKKVFEICRKICYNTIVHLWHSRCRTSNPADRCK